MTAQDSMIFGLSSTGSALLSFLALPLFGPQIQQAGGDVNFTATEIILVSGMLGTVIGALTFMFRAYQGVLADRIADLKGTILRQQQEIEFIKASGERVTAIAETAMAAYRERDASRSRHEQA